MTTSKTTELCVPMVSVEVPEDTPETYWAQGCVCVLVV